MCLPMSLFQNECVFTSHIMFTLCPVKHKAHFSHFTILQILQFTIYFLFLLFFLQFCNFSLKTQVVAFCFPAPTQIVLILSFCCSCCCCCYFFHFFKNTLHAIFVLFQRKFLLLLLFFSFLVVFNTFAYTLAATETKTIRCFSFKSLVQDLLSFVIFFRSLCCCCCRLLFFFLVYVHLVVLVYFFYKSKITILQNYSIFCQIFFSSMYALCTCQD